MTAARDPRIRLADVVENLQLARDFAARVSSPVELERDTLVRFAVLHALQIAGEAARHVPPELRAEAPDLPWPQITGMRNWIAHDYAAVDIGTIWHAATVDGPAAAAVLGEVLRRLDADAALPAEGGAAEPESRRSADDSEP